MRSHDNSDRPHVSISQKPKTHGGKRTGAGRPKQVDAPIRRTVYLDQRHIDFIEGVRTRSGAGTFSQALRGIIECDYEFHNDIS